MGDTAAIHCAMSGKRLARRDAKGIYLWCKECKVEHLIPWKIEDGKINTSDKASHEAVLRRSK